MPGLPVGSLGQILRCPAMGTAEPQGAERPTQAPHKPPGQMLPSFLSVQLRVNALDRLSGATTSRNRMLLKSLGVA